MRARRIVSFFLLAFLALGTATMPAGAGDADRDGDGMPDGWEESYGLDPDDPSDATEDPDGDDLVNRDEYLYDGDPRVADTDSDGIRDGAEVTRWQSLVNVPDRVVGRVAIARRCPTADSECRIDHPLGVTVVLSYHGGTADFFTRLSLANGRFTFGDVEPWRYRVHAPAVEGTRSPPPVKVEVEEGQTHPVRVVAMLRNKNGAGVVGQATQGPTCAAQREGEDCVAPLKDAPIRVKNAAGETVARATTDEDGYYAFELDPGDYKLVARRIDGRSLPDPPRPKRFTVGAGDSGPVVVNSSYESGIR